MRTANSDDRNVRERVLASAIDLFLQNGFSAVTVDLLGSKLGMSKKTIYRHFRSRRELELAAIDRFFAEVEERLSGAVGGAETRAGEGHGEVERSVGAFFRVVSTMLSRVNLEALELLEFRDPELWARINNRREHLLRTHLVPLVERGRARGEIRTDVDLEFIVGMMIALVLNLATPTRVSLHPAGRDGFLHDMSAVLLDGIRRHHEP